MARTKGLIKRVAKQRRHKKLFLDLFKGKACNISETCKAIGVHRNSFVYWVVQDPKFKEAVQYAEDSLIDMAESMLFKNISKGDTTAIIYCLKTKGKDRGWAEKFEHDVNFPKFTGIIIERKVVESKELKEIPEAEVIELKHISDGK